MAAARTRAPTPSSRRTPVAGPARRTSPNRRQLGVPGQRCGRLRALQGGSPPPSCSSTGAAGRSRSPLNIAAVAFPVEENRIEAAELELGQRLLDDHRMRLRETTEVRSPRRSQNPASAVTSSRIGSCTACGTTAIAAGRPARQDTSSTRRGKHARGQASPGRGRDRWQWDGRPVDRASRRGRVVGSRDRRDSRRASLVEHPGRFCSSTRLSQKGRCRPGC